MLSDISGTTKLCALIGNPVAHTLSPAMHNAAFSALGLDYVYLAFPVKRENLESAVKGLQSLGAVGYNVTVPYKTAVLPLLDEIDPSAANIGAVNTVVIREGKTQGYNTDGSGFTKWLESEGIEPAGKKIVVIGAGGASRAISFSLAARGAFIIVLNRTPEKARLLAQDIEKKTGQPVQTGSLDENDVKHAFTGAHIIINTTSAGMSRQAHISPVDGRFFREGLIVCDIIYNPSETIFLKMAKAAGGRTFNGTGMLLWQGALAFELWTHQPAPVEVMHEALVRRLGGL